MNNQTNITDFNKFPTPLAKNIYQLIDRMLDDIDSKEIEIRSMQTDGDLIVKNCAINISNIINIQPNSNPNECLDCFVDLNEEEHDTSCVSH